MDFGRIRNNVQKMISSGAPPEDIDGYLASEDLTPEAFKAQVLEGSAKIQSNNNVLAPSIRDAIERAKAGQPPAREGGEHMGLDLSGGDVARLAIKNAPDSAVEFGKNMVQPILDPIGTAQTLVDLGNGVIQKFIPGEHPDEEKANAVGQFFVDRYGSVNGIKNAMATDPVGVSADLAMVLTGGAMAGARVPGTAGRVASAAGRVAQRIDPAIAAGRLVKQAGKAVGKGVSEAVGTLGTHTGGESLRQAARAGYVGGSRGKAFADNMRGNVPMDQVVQDAKAALSQMRAERGAAYRAGMQRLGQIDTPLDFRPIDHAVAGALDIGAYKGRILNKSADGVRSDVNKAITEWRRLDPFEFHTPEGMDALKQKIGDIRSETKYGTQSRLIADRAYHAIKDVITEKAPEYAKTMRDYELASDVVQEIEKTLSLNPNASVDSSLRKLQSVMRNNANTNYGRRVDLVEKMDRGGGLMPQIAGQSLNSLAPRGLGRAVAGGTAVATGAGLLDPSMLATLPFQSPRIMGEAAYAGGKTARLAEKLVEKAPHPSVPPQLSFQAGRLDEQSTRALARQLMAIPAPN